ncbi:neuroparsin-A-like [Homarus americanus]|uniref:neuroparsin-A-like n=1 Tax=Homarus americanus TaxID=6706 RepID=UPI001C47BAAD|nr:neuroparsin-A-like [Homarus americanus]
MKTLTTLITFFVTYFCLVLLFQEAAAAPRCDSHDSPAPTNCKYGTVRDWCRNGVCAKGPGESCGGYWYEYGKCGGGTFCLCGTCIGCSTIDGTCSQSSPAIIC